MNQPLLQWTEEYRIGIKALDYEHQDLFAHIDRLLVDIARHDDKAEIEICLGKIHKRLQAHFALEEQFMKEKKYPRYVEHKREHDKFLDDFVDAMTSFENDPGAPQSDMLETEVKRWFTNHVLNSDKAMSLMTK